MVGGAGSLGNEQPAIKQDQGTLRGETKDTYETIFTELRLHYFTAIQIVYKWRTPLLLYPVVSDQQRQHQEQCV